MTGHDITLPGDASRGDLSTPAYASVPSGATRGMVVIHELFGRAPEIDAVVDRFASRGYAAVAPDLFAQGRPACVRAVMGALRSAESVAPVRVAHRARGWLCAEAGLTDAQVGIIGFCFGGGFALLAGPGFGAVSTNYGAVPSTPALKGIGPVLGCYGGRDLVFRNTGDLLRRRLAPLGIEPEVQVFPGAGHSFLTDGDHPIAGALSWPLLHVKFEPEIARQAWAKIDAFFERHLVAT